MQAVILAGGKGTRLIPYTKVFPKPLVPLGDDKPILDVILCQLKHFGFTRIILAVGHMAEMIKTYVHNGERYGLDVQYSLEDQPLGTAGPLAQIDGLEQSFLVMNGDIITDLNYMDLVEFHRKQCAIATIGTYQKPFKINLGIIQNNGEFEIVDYIEKPVHKFNVSMGVYVFDSKVIHYIEPQKYLDFPTLVRQLLDDGQKVVSYPFNGYWLDIGNHADFEKALEEYESMKGRLHLD
jgi:NDP-sugar pyrophosphorylase family protein